MDALSVEGAGLGHVRERRCEDGREGQRSRDQVADELGAGLAGLCIEASIYAREYHIISVAY